jgi:hypothetical protein
MHQLFYGSEEQGVHNLDRFIMVFIDDIFFIPRVLVIMRNIRDWCYRSYEIINYTPSTVNASSGLTRCHSLDISFLMEGY